ncbi:gp436 family protein [Acetobacter fallax]|uniref:DUF1320 domain-containing protein n=1 Tax=Acetobacter fallax TaxID=1737473 RepID=A0ABX0KE02_9PROT|nr:DUF1320 domain-containing protein [Acetobacter fallax]NHO33326.1 DUF1320 domain-containing protein [Acetobacter fallax]NHO36947.1 DUF1320 domain-containing protein [Acetobacter fallax]
MAYATLADLIERYGLDELQTLTASRDELIGEVNEARVGRALDEASSLIDSYLIRRYVVPVIPPTPALVHACCKLARYDLAVSSTTVPTDQMRADRKDAQGWLNDIGAGKATLEKAVTSDTSNQWSRFQARRPGLSSSRCF